MSRSHRIFLSSSVAALLAAGVLAALPAPSYAADADVKINEIDSNGGFPSDWVELVNTGATTVDIGNWVLKDSGEGNNKTLPAGTTLAPGARLSVDVDGLGDNDSARLFDDAAVAIDSVSWGPHASNGTWSRCPEGTGPLTNTAGTKDLPNACSPVAAWPGGPAVTEADPAGVIGGDFSGLAYEGTGTTTPGTLWGVRNGDGALLRLAKSGATWSPTATWSLKYPSGLGQPDTEGVTVTDAGAAGGLYVATERDGLNSSVSKPAILRVVPTGGGGSLSATHEWDLNDLGLLGANFGPEAVAWVPDSYLVANGLRRGDNNQPYVPADYPNHGNGLFFVGVEQTGEVVGYALNHANSQATRVVALSKVQTNLSTVTDLVFDPEKQALWVECDDNCNGRTSLMQVQSGTGAFVRTAQYERPTGGSNFNNEGFTITPRAECVGGVKPVFWADDGNDNGHALYAGTLTCTPASAPTISATASSAKPKTAAGWYGAPVTVTFACTPGSSPLTAPCPAPAVLSGSGADQSVTRSVTNGDGLSASATVSDLDVDLVAPAAKVKGVKKGKTYSKKRKPKCQATDALSGVASCTVTQKGKKKGNGKKFTVTATATDKAGNVTVVKVRYKVVPKPGKG